MTDTELPKKTMLIGGIEHLIVEPAPPLEPRYVDHFTELRVVNDVVFISLAALVADYGSGGPPELRVVTRLRMPLSALGNIQAAIEQILSQLAQAKQAAN